ncbi:hypothetical protein [Desulfurivibrio alkaliphilus]|uniref:Uncharacterized protein n=1 Tax=Desulfurivibrio alkaliphilus (strain DSM 19089 / UNIQEM U267 / AHT2) TaxID=589865 RepID=D6Z2I2_DESAT|nr:hypothetical protein [Desulfurivibrio alkaliphilus]ADH85757.1 hypothetical protein DaAHT2_1059 [Desulfurivibrio alkaliphilus AHT 2]
MSDGQSVQPPGEKMRRALAWVGECLADEPQRNRLTLLREAEIRFDLSPAECEFLDQNFGCRRRSQHHG